MNVSRMKNISFSFIHSIIHNCTLLGISININEETDKTSAAVFRFENRNRALPCGKKKYRGRTCQDGFYIKRNPTTINVTVIEINYSK